MYRVAIKESAIDASRPLAEALDAGDDGQADGGAETVRAFDSREAAERFAADLDAGPTTLRIQAAAPQDPTPVDGYLVPDGQRDEFAPVESDTHGTTFPVGANTYGALAIGLLARPGPVSPALAHHFAEEVPPDRRGRVQAVEVDPQLPPGVRGEVTWVPDLAITVAAGSGSAETYFAEVKAGNASFERNQRVDMRAVAVDHDVLKIRADLAGLPDRYTVRIDAVEPDG